MTTLPGSRECSLDSHQAISRENAYRLLHQMPNLHTLNICLAINFLCQTSELASRFDTNLTSLIAHTNGIRNFSIHSAYNQLPAICIINTMKLLPHLQYFCCTTITFYRLGSAKDFATALSELKELEHLRIHLRIHVSQVLDSLLRDYYPAAPNVLQLSVTLDDRFPISQASALISAWTPQLTHLELAQHTIFRESKDFNPFHHQFHLPSLIDLTICSMPKTRLDSLQCFKECKNICKLTYDNLTKSKLDRFWHLISTNFPQLKILTVRWSFGMLIEPGDVERQEDYETAMMPLRNLCQQNEIKFILGYALYNELYL